PAHDRCASPPATDHRRGGRSRTAAAGARGRRGRRCGRSRLAGRALSRGRRCGPAWTDRRQNVERSNLNRQVIFEEGDVGRPKVEAAAGRLLRLDAGLRVDARRENVRASNVAELFAEYEVVVDGTDAFETKFLLNDAAVLLR